MVRPRQLKLLAILKQNLTVNLPSFLNSLLHDTAERIRQARYPKTLVSHHGLIRLIVSHNLVQKNLTLYGLIAPLEISQDPIIQNSENLEMSEQGPVLKRKKTSHLKIEPHKCKRYARLKLAQRMFVNPQGSAEQPADPSRPISVQDSELEPKEQWNSKLEPEENDNSELELEEEYNSKREPEEEPNSEQEPEEEHKSDSEQEGVQNFDDGPGNEARPPQTPPINPQDDLLQDFEEGMAEVLANFNSYIQPRGSLDPNFMEAQSLGEFGHIEIMPSPEAANQEEGASKEIIHESDNQSGDTIILEHTHGEHQEPLNKEGIDKPILTKKAPKKVGS